VNANGMTAGHYSDPDLDCTRRAVFWESSGIARDLGGLTPLDPTTETTSNAMTDADASGGVVVVGQDTATNRGIVWWRSRSTSAFQAIRESDLVAHPCVWQFEDFRDINEKGWIVATGRHTTSGVFNENRRALLLVPDMCVADLDSDGQVNASDLGILLGDWGACPTPTSSSPYCISDLDCSGTVNASDLGILLGAWDAECVLCSEGFAMMSASEMSSAVGGPQPLSAVMQAITMFGFDDLDEFAIWFTALSANDQLSVAQAIATAISNGGGS